jgi:hypothetical protein
MNARLHQQPSRPWAVPEPHQPTPGYSQALSQRVAELRTRLRTDTAAALNRTRQERRAYLDNLMSKLEDQMFNDFCQRQQQERAMSEQRLQACDERRSQVEQTLRTAAEQRSCLARAGKSARAARALHRAGRIAELRYDAQQRLQAARVQTLHYRAELAARAQSDRTSREDFMQSLREQVSAMAEAFHQLHVSRCAESQQRRHATLTAIHDFVATVTGRPGAMPESCESAPPELSRYAPAAERPVPSRPSQQPPAPPAPAPDTVCPPLAAAPMPAAELPADCAPLLAQTECAEPDPAEPPSAATPSEAPTEPRTKRSRKRANAGARKRRP